jgi:uncharacterized protein (DUF1015 family)
MATIKPFPALRPDPQHASRICELPYDVMSSEEARQVAAGNPLSFLHVSKPEIDLASGVDVHSEAVYAKGRENFQRLIAQGALAQDQTPCFYLYRQIMGSHSQVGIVAAASCEDYLKGIIRKHELTRPDKEDDRVHHIESLRAQTGPAFLTYRSSATINQLVATASARTPSVDFTAADSVRHTAWVVDNASELSALEAAFATIPFLYIADGHHRSAAAARIHRSVPENSAAACFLSVIFPHDQVRILPYNRVLKDLNGMTPSQILEKLDGVFILQQAASPTPARRHELCLFLDGKWLTLHFRPRFAATSDPIEKLDVNLLQNYVLDPIFNIRDPRTSNRIQFVGGIRGTAELEKLVSSGEFACAFSMHPTSIEELMTIADAGGIMPPKSTWFEPKLRDGMFCYRI